MHQHNVKSVIFKASARYIFKFPLFLHLKHVNYLTTNVTKYNTFFGQLTSYHHINYFCRHTFSRYFWYVLLFFVLFFYLYEHLPLQLLFMFHFPPLLQRCSKGCTLITNTLSIKLLCAALVYLFGNCLENSWISEANVIMSFYLVLSTKKNYLVLNSLYIVILLIVSYIFFYYFS